MPSMMPPLPKNMPALPRGMPALPINMPAMPVKLTTATEIERITVPQITKPNF
jgi:hypothetical protein